MSTGAGPSGHCDLQRLYSRPLASPQSSVRLRLPYGIPGLAGDYSIATPGVNWGARFEAEYLAPASVIGHLENTTATYSGGGEVVAIRRGNSIYEAGPVSVLSLNPDRWGRSWRTRATLTADTFLDPKYVASTSLLPDMAAEVLRPCCLCLNRVLDAIARVGGSIDLPPLTPQDFFSLDVEYSDTAGYVGAFSVATLQTIWWGPRTAQLGHAEAEFRSLLADPSGLPLPDELLIASERKASSGDYRGSVVDAVCAVEAALGPYLDDKLSAAGVSKGKRSEFLGPSGVGLSLRVAVLVPLLHELQVPSEVLGAFSSANTKRNGIVHRGERADAGDTRRAWEACSSLIACLRGQSELYDHWDGQSFARRWPRT